MTASPPSPLDPFAAARAVADAVLYEGYVLYPYRASARKNQIRWQFGVLAPPSAAVDGSERTSMRTEVLVDHGPDALLTVRLRFLQVQRRTVEALHDHQFTIVDQLDVDGTIMTSWEEAVEHEVEIEGIMLLPMPCDAIIHRIDLPAFDDEAPLCAASGELVGRVRHHRERVEGRVTVSVGWSAAQPALAQVAVTVENTSDWRDAKAGRDDIVLHSLVAVHTLLHIDDGLFLSMLDPPPVDAAAVAACRNEGTFPVLIGDEEASNVMLSSPIILYDHPAVAPESAGDFCDSTEIDEILALRVMTLTDDEKAEARGTDPRAAAIIDRCDDMPPEMWSRLHGAIRSLRPLAPEVDPSAAAPTFDVGDESVPWWDPGTDASVNPWTDSITIGGTRVTAGTRVRLHPSRRADAHDLFYTDQAAIVKGVFRDVDGDTHVAVALEADLVAQELDWQGRFLYFHPDEIELVS